jgi:hypothetical protein
MSHSLIGVWREFRSKDVCGSITMLCERAVKVQPSGRFCSHSNRIITKKKIQKALDDNTGA